MGIIVTRKPDEPEVRDKRVSRFHKNSTSDILLFMNSILKKNKKSIKVWNTQPCIRGMLGTGVFVGTFFFLILNKDAFRHI